jgi:glycosyltransferase involved in cell wall biosynthesis
LIDERVVFTGRLPDLDDALRSARVFVCPLWSGTGTRIKLIEAMSYRLPIVTTSKGAEGLALEPGVHALFAENASEFAAAIGRLLADPALCLELGANARQLVRERYTWETQGAKLRALVARLTGSGCGEVSHG